MVASFGKTLRRVRMGHGVSVEQLSRWSGIHRETIHRYEKNRNAGVPTQETLEALVEALKPLSPEDTYDLFKSSGRPVPDCLVPEVFELKDALDQVDWDERERIVQILISLRDGMRNYVIAQHSDDPANPYP